MTTSPADGIPPDGKDWTWTLRERCPDCGFEAAGVAREEIAGLVAASTQPWPTVLGRPGAPTRPDPLTWSPLEYACHVRDVCRIFRERLALMLGEDAPAFANWDQDATAVEDRYGEQDPTTVGREVVEAGGALSAAFAQVPDDAWARTGIRSDGSAFTVLTLGQYGLHDLVHHLWDVGADRP
jgi:hypothetical protein